jgi:exopolysaccharide biosynthesis polyprenyl glycosylphosphotransferase
MRLEFPRELTRVFAASALATMSVGALAMVVSHRAGAGDAVIVHWLAATALLGAGRVAVYQAQRVVRQTGELSATLIVGAGVVGHTVAKRLIEDTSTGLMPIGFLDKDPMLTLEERTLRELPELPVLGASWDLEEVIARHHVEHVIIAFSTAPTPVLLDLVRRCWAQGVTVMLVPRLFEIEGRRMHVEHLGALPLIGVRTTNPRSWQFTVKYALDRIVAGAVITLLAPLYLAISAAVLVAMGRPIFFRQRRVGLDGKAFDMLKFRTMRGTPDLAGEADAAWAARALGATRLDAETTPSSHDRRTPVGSLLRAFSLDELPQLWNVLRGDMSLIGPRPERAHYVDQFQDLVYRYPDRHRVKSGLTGWAQVNGLRGETSLSDRIEWDNFYIENWSPWLDLRIVIKTIPALVTRRGA